VLTGFLGAGKTTLLNRLLKDPALADTAVVINEFGEIGIDHLLVEKVESGIVELAAGCICCTIRGDLVATLENLLRARDNGRVPPFRRLVIETTGLADPAPILQTLMAHPYLVLRYRLEAVVTVVDAVNGAGTLDRHAESVRQVAVADRLVLTKSDLAGPEAVADIRARIAGLAPAARVLDAARGEATPEAVLAEGLWRLDGKPPDVAGWLTEDGTGAHDHGAGAAFDVNRHDASIRAFAVATGRPIGALAFEAFLDLLRAAHGPKLLRVKGVVKLAEDESRPFVIQGVQHVFHPPVRLDGWPDEDRRTRLVFIVDGLAEEAVARLFHAFAGEPAVDAPDAAALSDNPLAPPGLKRASTAR
jgi:G3E family GTPase